MALEAALERLCGDLRKLCEILRDFDVNVGDKPATQSVLLADDVSDEVTELFALSQESFITAEEARKTSGSPFEANQLRRSLTESQKKFHLLSRGLLSSLLTYERIGELVQFGERKREWLGWVNSVRQGLERCRPAVEAVEDAYVQCWQEIAERVMGGPVALHTTNIGQQITTEALASRESARDGVT